ncbi:MAG: hypothetical protein QG670_1141 [Thermoproteota archaeon]|nr:hypothetical protein [Thermoproteota archaeon]
MPSITVTVEPEGRKISVERKIILLKNLIASGLSVRSDCGGKGECGKCRVILKDQKNANPISLTEIKYISEDDIKAGYRLACQLRIEGDSSIFIPSESKIRNRRFLAEGLERPVKLDSAIKKVHLHLPEPTLQDPRSDAERLTAFLEKTCHLESLEIDYRVIKNLSETLRRAKWDITVVLLNEKEVLAIEEGDTTSLLYGVAVDVGTSKIVASLIDLLSGETLALGSIENPQIIHGEDILSRISYAILGENELKELASLAINGVNTAIQNASERAKVSLSNIYEVVIVGNTAMHHIFLGLQPRHLALAPYIPTIKESINLKTEEVGLRINPCGNIHLPPIIAGFVGSDDIADLVATGINENNETALLLDVGTNTEVNVGNKILLLSCSCASGPAFEGANITHGMKAVEGAIEKVKIDPKTFKIEYEVIGNSKPVGICGSAMIDILAEMLRNKLLDKTGRFQVRQFPKIFKKTGNTTSFTIVRSSDTEIGKNIVFTQRDVRELQLAKAAIYAGCWILMEKRKVVEIELKRVYVAGAFGNYIEPANAKTIGLIPDVSDNKIELVGNTALSGAKMILKSKHVREITEELSAKVKYIELGADLTFNKEFSLALQFPHSDLNRFQSFQRDI